MSGRTVERCWSDVWSCSSWSIRPALSLVQQTKDRIVQYVNTAASNVY